MAWLLFFCIQALVPLNFGLLVEKSFWVMGQPEWSYDHGMDIRGHCFFQVGVGVSLNYILSLHVDNDTSSCNYTLTRIDDTAEIRKNCEECRQRENATSTNSTQLTNTTMGANETALNSTLDDEVYIPYCDEMSNSTAVDLNVATSGRRYTVVNISQSGASLVVEAENYQLMFEDLGEPLRIDYLLLGTPEHEETIYVLDEYRPRFPGCRTKGNGSQASDNNSSHPGSTPNTVPPGSTPNTVPPGSSPNTVPPGSTPNTVPPGSTPNTVPPGSTPNTVPPGSTPNTVPPRSTPIPPPTTIMDFCQGNKSVPAENFMATFGKASGDATLAPSCPGYQEFTLATTGSCARACTSTQACVLYSISQTGICRICTSCQPDVFKDPGSVIMVLT